MSSRFLLLALVLAVAACQSPMPPDSDMGPLAAMKPIHVERVRVQYEATFPPGSADLPYDEAQRLETFLDQSGVRPESTVFIASPPGDRLAAARLGHIAELLAQRSANVLPLETPPVPVEPDHLLLLVDRYIAVAPNCPDWSGSPATDHDNLPSSNFDCADATDFAQMIDNPRDLMEGTPLGPADADAALGAIERYRSDNVKPFIGGGGGGGGGGGSSSGSNASAGSAATGAAGAAASMAGGGSAGQ